MQVYILQVHGHGNRVTPRYVPNLVYTVSKQTHGYLM